MLNKLNETIKNLRHGWENPLNQNEKDLLQKLKNVTVSERVINYYKNNIKNNQDDSFETCRSKLIRNILLAKQAPIKEARPERVMYYMGNLAILHDDILNEIVWIDNKTGRYPHYIDKVKKEWLNKELGIENNITYHKNNYYIGLDVAK